MCISRPIPSSRCVAFVRTPAKRCSGAIHKPGHRSEFLIRVNKFRSFQLTANENRQSNAGAARTSDFQHNKTMKTKSIAFIAALALLPIAAFMLWLHFGRGGLSLPEGLLPAPTAAVSRVDSAKRGQPPT